MGHTKLVQTGGIIEIYEYEKEPAVRLRGDSRYRATAIRNPYRSRNRRVDNATSTIKSFRRRVSGNLYTGSPALLTLTMLDLVDISTAYKCFTSFGHKIRRVFGKNIAWVAVPEFQKRGAVHFHVLIWGLSHEFISEERSSRCIQNLWAYGYVDILETDGSQKLASYLTKYMFKALSDSRLRGKKAFSASRNLMSSVSINSPTAIDFIQKDYSLGVGDNLPIVEKTYGTLWLGRCNYKRYITR